MIDENSRITAILMGGSTSQEFTIKDGNGKYYILQKEQIDLIQFPDKEVTKMEEILSRTPCLTCYIPFGLSVPIDR